MRIPPPSSFPGLVPVENPDDGIAKRTEEEASAGRIKACGLGDRLNFWDDASVENGILSERGEAS